MARMIDVIGVPYALGGPGRGARAGPEALLRLGIKQRLELRGHNVEYQDLFELSGRPDIFSGFGVDHHHVHHQEELFLLASLLARQTGRSLLEGSTPVVLGGDHSIVIGSAGAALQKDVNHDQVVGLVWVDAHYDAHTEDTTHTGNTHGMPLATLLGQGSPRFSRMLGKSFYRPSQVIHIGAGKHDCEPEEVALLDRLGVTHIEEREISRLGWYRVYDSLNRLVDHVDALWVSFDLDVVCARDAPGVYYRSAEGGLTREEVLSLMNWLAHSEKVIGVDVVEYDPARDLPDARGCPKTAQLAIDLVETLLK